MPSLPEDISQKREYRKARLFLNRGGGFTLGTAICRNHLSAQQVALSLAADLESDGVSPLVLDATSPEAQGLRLIHDLQASLKQEPSYQAVIIYGFPLSGQEEQQKRYFQTLNMDRPVFPKECPHPTLFCFSEEGFRKFARYAPDLQHWSPYQFDLQPTGSTSLQMDTSYSALPLLEQVYESEPGQQYKSLAEIKQAEEIFREALTLNETIHGKQHPETILARANLANTLRQKGDLTAALSLAELNSSFLSGLGHQEVFSEVTALNDEARILKELGRNEDASALYQKALTMCETIYGSDHSATATTLKNFSNLLRVTNQQEKAQRLVRRALAIDERNYRPDHPRVVSHLSSLGSLLYEMWRLDEAKPLMQRVLEVRKRVLGEEHPDTLGSLNNLAGLYESQGSYEKAQPLFEQCLEVSKRVLGEEHPDTLTSLNNLALLYKNRGAYEKAQPLYEQCLEVRKRVLGEEHPDTLGSLNNLASLYFHLGEYQRALPLFKDCLLYTSPSPRDA